MTICDGQNIKQEEFLTQIRMQIMSVLLSLIEKDAAQPDKLQVLKITTKTYCTFSFILDNDFTI